MPGSRIVLKSVGLNPTRSYLLTVLKKVGAEIIVEKLHECNGELRGDLPVQSSDLEAFELSGKDIPLLIDENPVLAVLATRARGRTFIGNVGELRFKESDRLQSITENLWRSGADIKLYEDGMAITGPTPLKGTVLPSFGDHRIAMAFSISGLIARGKTVIQNAAVVAISCPGFYITLKKLSQQRELT